MANDKKPEGAGNAAPKVETTTLKVLIHCEGCRKQVKKTLFSIDGVHSVEVDGSLGKVTVIGTVDAKVLIKKLEKAGKVVEPFSSNNKGKDQAKGNNNKENHDEGNGANADAEKKDNNDNGHNNNNNGGGESGKKKKGGGGAMNPLDDSMNMVNKSIALNGIQTGYIPMGSADYATNMFSDENANFCHIM
ncbi:hypothetical protein GOP47_0016804 [Adiantum capillus-veneris]|uniref:HMA domain-containing protein n=1 Tax=Adiantum capillus-veneris TaxID=13818 RepID=A0A9D4UJ57_ADICA|nr:hypothetical protein GOP47_0016804 [Adiantum capillus-veneris]